MKWVMRTTRVLYISVLRLFFSPSFNLILKTDVVLANFISVDLEFLEGLPPSVLIKD